MQESKSAFDRNVKHRLIRIFRIVATNVLIFVCLVGLIEVIVRLTHPEINSIGIDRGLIDPEAYGESAGLRPGAVGKANGILLHVDERGFLTYSASQQEQPGWLFLGDSVTMGLGVESDSTFAGRLAAAQQEWSIQNASLVGYSSADYARVLSARLEVSSIARVTVFWTLNDIMAGKPVATAPKGVRLLDTPIMQFVRRYWYTYQWLKGTFTDRPLAYYSHDVALYDSELDYLDSALSDLAQIKALSDERGISFQVVLIPYEYGIRSEDERPHDVMRLELEKMEIDYRDLLPVFRASDRPQDLYLFGDGIHLSRKGHSVVAEQLLRWLQTP